MGGPAEPGWRGARQLLTGALRVLIAGQCLGQAADGLAQISFAQFVVFEAGRGATPERIAALLAATLLPFSLVGPVAGVLIDRWERRRVLVVVSLLRALLTLGALATVLADSTAGAFVGVLLLLSSSRFVLAAKGAALPRTVAAHELVTGNALSAISGMSATFLGAVGGAAFVGRSAGAGFVASALLYGAASAAFTRLPDVGGGHGRPLPQLLRQAGGDVAEGLQTIVRVPAIGRPLAAVWLHRLLLGAGFVVLVLVADSRFHLRIAGYGLALGVTGVAAFLGTLAAPVLARRWPPFALLPATFVPPAVAAYSAGLAPNLVLLVLGLAVTALSFQTLKVLVDALVGGASPDQVRGRVFSVYDVLYNVAFVLAGLLLIPLWDPQRVRSLLWLVAAGFAVAGLLFSRWLGPRRVREPRAVPAYRWRLRLAAALAGALPVLAFPAPAWWWLAWAGLVPLLLLLRGAPTAREAGLRAWYAGTGFILAAGYWLAPSLGPALGLLAAGLGLLWWPWGRAAHRLLAGRPGAARASGALLVLPAGWLAIEAVRSWPSLGGPWALLGASQWNQRAMLASAALGGVWLTGFLVVLVNTAVTIVLVSRSARLRLGAAAAGVAALAVGPAWAGVRPAVPDRGTVRVAVVQPGVVQDPAVRLARQEQLTAAVLPQHPDLIVWGESSVGYDLAARPDITARLVSLSRLARADLLVNVDARRRSGGITKSSVLVTPAGLDGHYDKTRLVPFGEYIPLRRALGWVGRVSGAAREDRRRGHGPVVLAAGRVALGPLICFESTFPDMGRSEARLGAQLIVYESATTTFQGSWAQPQHAALAAVRAVETGRPVLHVALSGTSAAFDGRGRRLLWIPAGRSTATVLTVPLAGGRTPYDVAGDWVLGVAAAILGAAIVVDQAARA